MAKTKMYKEHPPAWEDQKATLKMRFPQLTDADLDFPEARKMEMLNNIQLKVNRSPKELMTIMAIK
jgi:hypothetical protein